MWEKLLELSEDKLSVLAKLMPDVELDNSTDQQGLENALEQIQAQDYFVLDEEVDRFLKLAKKSETEAYEGVTIAEVRDVQVQVVISENDMLATMVLTGAYQGQPLTGPKIVNALAEAHVVKGINKLALKKVLVMSHKLKPGEIFEQPVAIGKPPVDGQDTELRALVEDPTKLVLAPKEKQGEGKVDMLNLGGTVSVAEGDALMERIPATEGEAGVSVLGRVIPAKVGKDMLLKEGKGSVISNENPNLLIAAISGMPVIHDRSVDVTEAICLPTVGVGTGHVKFKGDVVVLGNVESDMIVRATGSVTVGGFIESADVQAKGDIHVAKGIIGHNVSEGEERSCVVKSGGSIYAKYAQFSELQAAEDIHLDVHCMNSEVRCGKDLIVSDANGKQGTLSGGHAKVGGKVKCVELGVEGDTATYVEAFARFQTYKERQAKLKEQYTQSQEATMAVIRQELELKKIPKSERTPEQEQALETQKLEANTNLEAAKLARDVNEADLNHALEEAKIEVIGKVFTHVTAQFGDEKITTKRVHGPSVFSFNQYEIKCSSMLDEEAFEQDEV